MGYSHLLCQAVCVTGTGCEKKKKKVDWIWHRPKPAIGNPSTDAPKSATSTLKQKGKQI